MLNRRILRVKAMQSLYGFFIAKESLLYVKRGELEKFFTPDPLVDDLSDTSEKDEHRKLALKRYDENIRQKKLDSAPDIPDIVFEKTQEAIQQYYSEVLAEARRMKSTMLESTRKIQSDYYKFLMLPGEFQFIEKQYIEKKELAYIHKKEEGFHNLQQNPIIEALNTCEPLQQEITVRKLSWQSDHENLKSWYKEVIRKDEQFIEYDQKENPTVEDHTAILTTLFKKLLTKNETLVAHWEEQDIKWTENSIILRSMLTKTIQSYEPESDEPITLKTISLNEEDDFEFFETVYDATLQEDERLEDLINKQTKNWDISRLAMTDRIILKMALAEMIHCRSIPVKVSLNEYIEICKQYSTPRSKQFVNGILDVLANQLTSEGVIKKTGRGLIDNK